MRHRKTLPLEIAIFFCFTIGLFGKEENLLAFFKRRCHDPTTSDRNPGNHRKDHARMTLLELPVYEFSGTPEQVGLAHGETLRSLIQGFTQTRFQAANDYLKERNLPGTSIEGMTALAQECMRILQEWDPAGHAEHLAIARGANVDPDHLFIATGYTDLRDAYLLAATGPDAEGCTAVLLPGSQTSTGGIIGAQSWDLNPRDLEYVVAILSRPEGQPAKWSISTAGCVSLMGMNEHGIAVGTTNIKTRGAKAGVSYINLLHRALRSTSPDSIGPMLSQAPRSGAHTYWMVHEQGGWEYEMTPDSHEEFHLKDQCRVWTNHCLVAEHSRQELEPPSASSMHRIAKMSSLMAAGAIGVDTLKKAFSDRSDGVYSINRYPEDNQGTATNACMIAIPAERKLYACKGPADRGRWRELVF